MAALLPNRHGGGWAMKYTISFDPWAAHAFFAPAHCDSPEPIPPYSHLLTTVPGRSGTVRDELIKLIDSASQRVFLCSFLIGGQAVRDALRRAVHRLHGHVYVITALDDRTLERSLQQEMDEIDRDALRRERKSFEAITRFGVYVRGASDCHAKFCVVDDQAALVGSANFDPNGLDLAEPGARACGEIALPLAGAERVAPLAALFRHLWRSGCQREAPPHPSDYRLSGVVPVKAPAPTLPRVAGGVVWTGFGSKEILAGIFKTIAQAKETLVLGSYSFTAVRENLRPLLDEIASAQKRGVQIELLVRDRSRDLPEIAALLDIGVDVRANRENHAKYAIADNCFGLIFSANFDGVHGLTSGVETGVWLTTQEAREVASWHAQSWREAPFQVARWQTPADFKQAISSVRHEVPPFLGGQISIVGGDEPLRRCATILAGPCLLVYEGDGTSAGEMHLVGVDDMVELKWNGSTVSAFGVERSARNFLTLPKLIASSKNRRTQCWLPLGLQVNLA